MSYHSEIMNIPDKTGGAMFIWAERESIAFKIGHHEARHAAAEIALHADNRIEDLEEALQNARSLLITYVGTKTRAESISDLFKQMSEALGE